MSQKDFLREWSGYTKLINADIEAYCSKINKQTDEIYGNYSLTVSKVYTDVLRRGGKRMRGALTCVGYEMCGGTDKKMIIKAARAIEMMHAYMLIIDDIQDRSNTRRGGKSAHIMLESEHKLRGWSGDAPHTGIALALNAALLGSHNAELVLSNLKTDEELRLKALNIMNHTMMVTAHGQTNDIINEIAKDVSLEDIGKVMQWKSAHYSVLNPIHTGMVLAGAPCEDTNAVTDYAINIGKAFQVTDDLLVTSSKVKSGKDVMDDIREGKRTLLTVYALSNASSVDADFLKSCLGSQNLTVLDFKRCKSILIKSGAVQYAKQAASDYIKAGRKSLKVHAGRWDSRSVEFLDELAQYLLTRTS